LTESSATYAILEKCLQYKREYLVTAQQNTRTEPLYIELKKEMVDTSEAADQKPEIDSKVEFRAESEPPTVEPVTKAAVSTAAAVSPAEKSDNVDEKPLPSTVEYNSSAERTVQGTIFSDGNLYCIQHSSWQTREKAESVASQLESEGHNAIVMEAFIGKSNKTWYRVRIGFFNSLAETKEYMKNL
jgi:cell division protein FtsN